jgi:hypothetical protein
VAVAHQRYWQARRMQAVAETSSAHRHAPETFKLQELRLAATGRLSGGAAAAAGECASQPNRTQPGTSNIPRRVARPELARVECAARSQVQRTVCARVRSSRVSRVSRVASCPRDATTTMAVAARLRSVHSSTRPWEAGCSRPPVVSIIKKINKYISSLGATY